MDMNVEQQIEVMKAHGQGKEIEFKARGATDGAWTPCASPRWNWVGMEYRVAVKAPAKPPAPLELHAAVYSCPDPAHPEHVVTTFDTAEQADDYLRAAANVPGAKLRIARFVEAA